MAILIALTVACTGSSAGDTTPSSTARAVASASATSVTTSIEPSTTASVPQTYPDGWFDLELVPSAAELGRGQTITIDVVCPHRDEWEATVDIVHESWTFPSLVAERVDRGLFRTEFVVPYWLPPGTLSLRGACPEPPGPCDDTDDCPEYQRRPTPPVAVESVGPSDRPWDAWRPAWGPVLDFLADAGTELAGGAVVEVADPPYFGVIVGDGDRVPVRLDCPATALVEGARFVVVRSDMLQRLIDLGADAGWESVPDTEVAGRWLVRSDGLAVGEESPWFAEVPALSSAIEGDVAVVRGELVIGSSLVTAAELAAADQELVVTATCESVGDSFDPRSLRFDAERDDDLQVFLTVFAER